MSKDSFRESRYSDWLANLSQRRQPCGQCSQDYHNCDASGSAGTLDSRNVDSLISFANVCQPAKVLYAGWFMWLLPAIRGEAR